jgi:hypothetical protein
MLACLLICFSVTYIASYEVTCRSMHNTNTKNLYEHKRKIAALIQAHKHVAHICMWRVRKVKIQRC